MKLIKLKEFKDLPKELQIKRLKSILKKLNFPITLVIEEDYQDREYKDIFYHFYASKFLNFEKDSKRILILQNLLSEDQLLDANFNLEENIVGIIVLRPLKGREIGKTFINPKFLNIPFCYIRKTPFTFGMLGRKFSIDSFPFASQDGEYMTCAETSLWMILHYYGSRYQEYKIALPSEIVEIVDNNHYVRVLPSKGLYFSHSSMVLKKFGFSSQIYHKDFYNSESFKRYFHYYIESGIPLMVGIRLKNKNIEKGHAIVCIGHGKLNFNKMVRKEDLGKFNIINSADLIEDYVFMDDNKTPFEIRQYNKFDYPYEETQIKYFIVPLYKRIFLDAIEAEAIFYEILKNHFYHI